jgi:gamma-F420-2:alpha-L-glutamate ligase
MEIWILYGSEASEYPFVSPAVNRLWEAAEQRGILIRVVAPTQVGVIVDNNDKIVLVDGERVALPDFVLTRMGAHIHYAGLAVTRQLESLGVKVVNCSEGLEIVTDKLRTAQILSQHRLPTPRTMLLPNPIDLDMVEHYLGFPLVVKLIKGNKGNGVTLIDTKDRLNDFVEFMLASNINAEIILQQLIAPSKGRDLRVFVVGQQVVECMERHAKEGGFKANFHQGGSVEAHEITPEIEELAFDCAELLKVDIFGMDLLFGEDGYVICEVNASPGWEGLEIANPGLHVADLIYDYIEAQLETPLVAKGLVAKNA